MTSVHHLPVQEMLTRAIQQVGDSAVVLQRPANDRAPRNYLFVHLAPAAPVSEKKQV